MLIGNSGNTCQVNSAAASCLETLLFLLLHWKKKKLGDWKMRYKLYHFFCQVSAGFQCYSDFVLAAELDPRAMHDGGELLVEGHCLSARENWQQA